MPRLPQLLSPPRKPYFTPRSSTTKATPGSAHTQKASPASSHSKAQRPNILTAPNIIHRTITQIRKSSKGGIETSGGNCSRNSQTVTPAQTKYNTHASTRRPSPPRESQTHTLAQNKERKKIAPHHMGERCKATPAQTRPNLDTTKKAACINQNNTQPNETLTAQAWPPSSPEIAQPPQATPRPSHPRSRFERFSADQINPTPCSFQEQTLQGKKQNKRNTTK